MTQGFIVVSALMLLAACSDDTSVSAGGAGGDAPTAGGDAIGGTGSGAAGPSGGSPGTGGADALSFEEDIWPVLIQARKPALSGASDSCSGANGCHLTGAGGLALPSQSEAYNNLIDMPSSSAICDGLLHVVAGEPDQSCFVVFYEIRLRDQLGWVDQAETDRVRQWVADGAMP